MLAPAEGRDWGSSNTSLNTPLTVLSGLTGLPEAPVPLGL